MKIKVKDISIISTGIYTKTSAVGDVYYLQARDFDEQRKLKVGLNPNISGSNSVSKHLLQKGNLLIAAKAGDFFAAVYHDEVTPAVASSMFLVLREVKQQVILPQFLAWQINHPKVQKQLTAGAKGTNLLSINKSTVGELELLVPTMDKQKAILHFEQLRNRERQLSDRITALKDKVIDQKILNALTK
ncbi:MAG: restriction endonuclease subunit S [Marinilabiliaceae bacterium]|nr:restriction endonuclease subunit S [Marinilabiliaceae bacterium]